jgi:hypothetical protein
VQAIKSNLVEMALSNVKKRESLAAAIGGPGLKLTGAAPVAIATPYLLAGDPPTCFADSHDRGYFLPGGLPLVLPSPC